MTEMGELEAGKAETHSFEEIKKILEPEGPFSEPLG